MTAPRLRPSHTFLGVLVWSTCNASVGLCATIQTQAVAAPTTVADSVVQCRSCRIGLGSAIQLRGVLGDGSLPGTAFALARASDGSIYVGYNGEYGTVVVHDANGEHRGVRLGRSGAGLGEFQRIKDIRSTADTLRVYDLALPRRTDFHRTNGTVIRTVAFPNHLQSIVFPGEKTVLSGSIPTRQAAGFPLHLYSTNGVWQRSFGVDKPALRPGFELLLFRRIAQNSDASFWAAPINEYRLELWDTAGTLIRTIEQQRPWFKPWTEAVARTPAKPPNSNVTDIRVDQRGLLWVLLSVAHPDWKQAFVGQGRSEGGYILDSERPYMASLLEVIDPADGAVLARHRFPFGLWGFAGEGSVWRTWIDSKSDLPRVEVIPVSFSGRRQ